MNLNLNKPICFFDIEATGLNVIRDRIVQIAIIKCFPGDRPNEELSQLINPSMPISDDALAVHGITPKMLANQPTFQQVAEEIFEFIGDSDLAGYNSNRFDVPMLMEEFARVGMDFNMENRRTVDVQRIFYKMEPRTLKAALKFYQGKELENAHDALADVKATLEVLEGQLTKYEGVPLVKGDGEVELDPVRPDVQQLHDFTNDDKMIDATKRLKYNHEGVVVFNFGKYAGQPAAEVLTRDKQYYQWILNKEFSTQVKTLVKQLVKEYDGHRKA
ncbi:MAG: 3'-5' exonuclease [Saprospiraceae bacterium]|nr:3'-5' exonuclease [Saprospiraceae bacterium]